MHLSLQTFGGSGSNKCQISNYKPNQNLRYVVPAEHHSLEEEFHDEALLLMVSIFSTGSHFLFISFLILAMATVGLKARFWSSKTCSKTWNCHLKAYNSHSF